jgi:hypothetical protein
MATKFPLIINDVRFSINPKNISVRKALNIAQVDTMGGRQYQIWWPQPEIMTLQGETLGETAYQQLMNLKQFYEGTKLSTLTYKVHTYKGYIISLDVTADTQNLQVWSYTLNFQLIHGEKFAVEDFSLSDVNAPVFGEVTRWAENINQQIAQSPLLGGLSRNIENAVLDVSGVRRR